VLKGTEWRKGTEGTRGSCTDVTTCNRYLTKAFKGVTQNPVSVFKRLYLLLSGLVILGFVVVHLQHFRFHAALDVDNNNSDSNNKYALAGAGASGDVDFHALMLDTFEEGGRAVVVGYLVSVAVLGVHLYLGWNKAVYKMDLDAQHGTAQFLHPVRKLGYALAIAVTAGFAATVLAVAAGK
jgi:hypothetical protein